MVAPHFGGRQANPNWHNGKLERFIEIFSEHRRAHDWAYEFMRRDYRLGIIAGGDDHGGRPGYGFLVNPLLPGIKFRGAGAGLVAVLAPSLTREAIFDALFARHAYATTGQRTLLKFTAGDAMMGDEIAAPAPLSFRATVEAASELRSLEIWKNVTLVHKVLEKATSANLEWTDPAPPSAGETAMYWLRVIEADGEEAVSSPIWWKNQ